MTTLPVYPPLGYSESGTFADPSYDTGEHMELYVTRSGATAGRTPVMYFHGENDDALSTLVANYRQPFNAIAGQGYPVLVPRLGGTPQWATNDIVGTGGFADHTLTYANSRHGTRADKTGVMGLSMGAFNGLNWAWRNAGKVRSVVLLGPIPDISAFYTANPSYQAGIDADWGSHGAFVAALPTINPIQNLDKIRPFAHRVQIWYAAADQYIDPNQVLAFAELIGAADVRAVPGTHEQLVTGVRADVIGSFTGRQMVDRRHVYVGWDDTDLDRVQQVVLSANANPALRNRSSRHTLEAVGGRRFGFVREAGTDGNERFGQLLTDFEAPDMAVKNLWYNGDGAVAQGLAGLMVGQPGNIMRAHIDPATNQYLIYIAWCNILFGIPWIINRGVWSGTLEIDALTLLGIQNSVIPGLRLSAGGLILASSRTSNVVTLVVHEADLDNHFRSGILDIVMPGAIGSSVSTLTNKVTRVDANHLQYTLAGPDVVSGGPGSWADFATCFPYWADTELAGPTMRGRFYRPGQDPPAWGDPDWTFTWQDTGPWGWPGYGRAGIMNGHIGIFDPGLRAEMTYGALTVDEL
jgi:pimeloyl-ACP methyl ester carboxylesterase